MKHIVILTFFTMSACGPWSGLHDLDQRDISDYRLIAGIRWNGESAEAPNPVVDSALRKAGVQFFYGDHSARLTQLYCFIEDFDDARVALDALPNSERSAVVMFDPDITEASISPIKQRNAPIVEQVWSVSGR